MRTVFFILCFGLFAGNGQSVRADSGGSPRIEIKKAVYLEHDEILLGDILTLYNMQSSLEDEIRKVVIGQTPKRGEEVIFSDRAISEILRNEISHISGQGGLFVFSRIPLKIPNEIHIRRAEPLFNEINFKEAFIDILKKDCTACEFQVLKLRLPPPPVNTEGHPWEIDLSGKKLRGPFQVRVNFKDGDQLTATQWVNGEIRISREVAVSLRVLNTGERVQPGDFKFLVRDVTFATDTSPTEFELIGAKVRRMLRADEMIAHQDIERERMVSRGENIQVVYANPNFQISMRAISQDAGMIGDNIRVQNTSSKKVLNGVVISKGVVEIR